MPQNPVAAPAQPDAPQHSKRPSDGWRRWRALIFVSAGIALLFAIGFVFFLRHWPFSRDRVAQSLHEDFDGAVSFGRFRITYFPRPGCVAEGLRLVRPGSPPGSPPLAYVHRFTLRANYHDLIFRPGYISSIVLEGLHIVIPSRGLGKGSSSSKTSPNTRVGEVSTKDALLEIGREHHEPLRFQIHSLTLHSVSEKTAITYDAAFHNPLPPGEIQSRGQFGPWNTANPGQTPVSGTYQFDKADLGVFDGISGTLSSRDSFQGVLTRIEAHGKVDIPDFHITRSVHKVHLQSSFDAFVNAFNGDVQLPRVDASLLQTTVSAKGSVAGRPGQHGKTTSLDMAVRNGRIQDLLRLITQEPRPSLDGMTNMRAHVDIPPEGRPFLKEVQVTGDFAIVDGQFTKPDTQKQIVDLSDRSRGKKPPDKAEDKLQEDIRSTTNGHVVLKDGTANLDRITFSVPGAIAVMHGTFNVITERINFHGDLKTDASFSKTAGGIKSILLKPFDAAFKRKPKGASIPVKVDGTYSDPHPGVELGANNNQPSEKEKQSPSKSSGHPEQ